MTVHQEYKPLDNIGVGLLNLTYVSELILNWILFVNVNLNFKNSHGSIRTRHYRKAIDADS